MTDNEQTDAPQGVNPDGTPRHHAINPVEDEGK